MRIVLRHLGAFRESLIDNSQDIVLAWAHDLSKPLASRNAGALLLHEDGIGLAFDAALNDTAWSMDAHAAVQSGTVSKMSFGFLVREGGDRWERQSGKDVRIVTNARLLEISPVVFPVYSGTKVGVRTAAEILASRPNLDHAIIERDLLRLSLDLQ
jgi:HK97 family phage prohead protease